jgi:RHS repeat-associated protein
LRTEVELRSLPSFDPTSANPVQQVDLNYELTDHLGNVCAVVTGRLLDGNGGGTPKQAELVSAQGYEPFGSLLPGRNYSSGSYRYLFQGQEHDDEIYGATSTSYTAEYWQYDPRVVRRWNIDPVVKPWESSYLAFAGNPVMMVDPNGANASSDVTKNKDGSYTVVDAKNDGDRNIYVRGEDGKRTGEIIGQTLTPFDFMATNDQTGEFRRFDQKRDGVTFRLDNLKVTGTVFDNVGEPTERSVGKVYGADGNRLINYGTGNFAEERGRRTDGNFYSDLKILRDMSGNNQELDFKASLKLHPNTAIGLTTESGTYITTLRAIGNITFGMNIAQTRPPLLGTDWYYSKVMEKVGEYNQSQNTGTGYNAGAPFYGEHTYSGTFIYFGYFGQMP